MSKGKTKTKNHNNKKKKQRIGHAHVQVHMGIFVIYRSISSNFLSILERKYFGMPEEKTPRPHKFFPSPNQTPTKKVFLPIFSPKFFIHLFYLQTNTALNYVITTVQRDGSVLESPLLEELFTKPPRITFIYPKKSKEKEIRVDA